MPEYVFIRKEGFYPINLQSPTPDKTDDEYAIDNAKSNPGTIKVIKLWGGKQIQLYPK